jgi:hypothetical protein
VKGNGSEGLGGTKDKEVLFFSVHTVNIISQQKKFAARCISFYVGNVFG